MKTIDPKDLSPLSQAAFMLDGDIAELERLSQELSRLSVDSDNSFNRARSLLTRFAECGQGIGDGVQELAKALTEAQARADKAAQIINPQVAAVQRRHQLNERMQGQLQSLGEMVREVTTEIARLHKPASGDELTAQEKEALLEHLPGLDARLGGLIDEAAKLREEAHAVNMKGLESNADSLRQSMQAARHKLSVFIDRSAGRPRSMPEAQQPPASPG